MKFRDPKNVDTIFVIHLYYYEMLDDLCLHLDKLKKHMDFEVIVSTTPNNESNMEEISKRLDAFMVLLVENRGRDVFPFLRTLPYLENFKYACKIHTKTTDPIGHKGPRDNPYGNWRDYMWSNLMNLEGAKEALVELDKGSSIYVPKEMYFWRNADADFVSNLDNMNLIGKTVDMKIEPKSFIAGTMFWFQVDSLIWLNEHDFESFFDPEEGAIDGKMEHAFERSFVQLARKKC
jgi:rhamnosyltransferase